MGRMNSTIQVGNAVGGLIGLAGQGLVWIWREGWRVARAYKVKRDAELEPYRRAHRERLEYARRRANARNEEDDRE